MIDEAKLADKTWRLNNLYKIVPKQGPLITFNPNAQQKHIMETAHSRNIILKARQLGITTYEVMDILDDCIFNDNFYAALIAHEQKPMEDIFEKVLIAWEYFPKELKDYLGLKADTRTKNKIAFNNGSNFKIQLSGRSGTLNRLHISEFGKICAKYPVKAREIVTGAIPAVVPNGRIDIESTAEGDTGYFYNYFMEAYNRDCPPRNRKEYKAYFFPWTQEPLYQENFETIHEPIPARLLMYQEKHNLTDDQLAWYFLTEKEQEGDMLREYPATVQEAFDSGIDHIFPLDIIDQMIEQDTEDVAPSGNWKFFEEYKQGHRYGLGADVAEGIGGDHSAIVIIDFSHKEKHTIVPKVVATYKSNQIDPIEFAHEIKNGATLYGGCIVAPERNNHGYATVGKLKEIYHNIYKERVRGRESDKELDRFGWHTSAASKPEIIYQLKVAIQEAEIIIPDKSILTELRSYGRGDLKRMKADPESTNHFDLLMALAIAWEMRNEANQSQGITYSLDEEEPEYEPYSIC